MKKHQVHTTLSQRHWELLKKLSEKYDSQQKVLEAALEKLANGPEDTKELTPEKKFLIRISSDVKTACMIPRDGLKELMRTADVGGYSTFVMSQRPMETSMEFLMEKNAKECSQKELIENFILNARVANWFDMINYSDDGDHYTIRFYHSLGLNNSKISEILCKSMFDPYGYRTEYEIMERYLFVKVFKK